MTVEEFEFGDAEPTPSTSAPRSRARGARPWFWSAAAFALVLVGTATATPVSYLGGPTGISIGVSDLDLREAPTVAWEVSLAYASLFDSSDEVVVVSESATGLDQTLVGLAIENGEELWRLEDPDRSCHVGDGITCVTDPGSDDARVVHVDVDSGAIERTAEPGVVAAITLDDGRVLAYETGFEDEQLIRLDSDGVEVWNLMTDVLDTSSTPSWTYMSVEPGSGTVNTLDGSYDLATGELSFETFAYVLDDGVHYVSDGAGTWVRTADAEVAIDPDEALASVTDAIGGPVRLRESGSGGYTAEDRDSGRTLWAFEQRDCQPQLQLRGIVLMTCWGNEGYGSVALDERTGETAWQLDEVTWPLQASPDTILMVTQRDSAMIGVDLHTGRERWRVDGIGAGSDIELDGALLRISDTRIARLEF